MFLICFPQLGFGQLSCMMKKDVNTTELNLGNNTLAHLKVEDGRNASFIHVFECKCNPNELVCLCQACSNIVVVRKSI